MNISLWIPDEYEEFEDITGELYLFFESDLLVMLEIEDLKN